MQAAKENDDRGSGELAHKDAASIITTDVSTSSHTTPRSSTSSSNRLSLQREAFFSPSDRRRLRVRSYRQSSLTPPDGKQEEDNAYGRLQQLQWDEAASPLAGPRAQALSTLQDVYRQVVQRRSHSPHSPITAFVGVSGPAGVGKSILVKQALEGSGTHQRNDNRCWTARGKFAAHTQEPYAACRQVVANLCAQFQRLPDVTDESALNNRDKLSSSTPLTLSEARDTLAQALEAERNLFTTAFPAVGKFLSNNIAEDSSNATNPVNIGDAYADALDRLAVALSRFWQVVSAWRPLILVLEDVQWADAASLQLLQASWPGFGGDDILDSSETDDGDDTVASYYESDETGGNFMVVACYRTTAKTNVNIEVELTPLCEQVFGKMIPPSLRQSGRFHHIQLEEWSVTEVTRLLAIVLGTTANDAKTKDLADVVVQKTHGNPRYVVHYCESLVDAGILSYHLVAGRWLWDLDKVRQETFVTENVVEGLRQSLLQQHASIQTVLVVAACLGGLFDRQVLLLVLVRLESIDDSSRSVAKIENNIDDTMKPKDWLMECIQAGFLESTGDDKVRFPHDDLQEAALVLRSPNELEAMKTRIVRILLESFTGNERDSVLFATCALVNGIPLSCEEQLVATRVNYLAGMRAMSFAAFEYAAKCLRRALDLLPDNKWGVELRSLTVDIFTMSATAESCLGEFARVESICKKVMENPDVSIVDKAAAYHLLMLRYMAEEDHLDDAFNAGIELLELLNVRLPVKSVGISWNVSGAVANESRKKLVHQNVEQVDNLPVCEDEKEVAVMKTLDLLTSICLNHRPSYLPVIAIAVGRRTKKYGISPHSAISSHLLGGFCAVYLGDLQIGKLYGKKAMELSENLKSDVAECRVTMLAHAFVLHWTLPLQTCSKAILDAHVVGMKSGDLVSAFWCLFYNVDSRIFLGHNLSVLEREALAYRQKMEDHGQHKVSRAILLLLQTIQNLQGSSASSNSRSKLTGDYMDEDELLKNVRSEESERRELLVLRRIIYMSMFFCDYERIAKIATREGNCPIRAGDGQFGDIEVMFACGLGCLAMARKGRNRRKYQRRGVAYCYKMKEWASKGNPNCLVHNAFLTAERHALKRKKDVACKDYQEAIRLAGRSGLVNLQALANERLANFLQDEGDFDDAEYYIKEAVRLYEDWGALGKAAQIKDR